MNNPNGPYPGRQLFLGRTSANQPFFVYLITGRSPESRERKAIIVENTVRIGPTGAQPYDPLRHYSALKYDQKAVLAAVSNGIQTEAIFETYRLIYNTASSPDKMYLEMLLEGAGAEPDSLHTPRIAGLISPPNSKKAEQIFMIGIKAFTSPARAVAIHPEAGTMIGISTYKGSLDNPDPSDPSADLSELKFGGASAEDVARFLFEISAASFKGNDIRVCTVGGLFSDQHGWVISTHNVH